jgi:hypothetical protein
MWQIPLQLNQCKVANPVCTVTSELVTLSTLSLWQYHLHPTIETAFYGGSHNLNLSFLRMVCITLRCARPHLEDATKTILTTLWTENVIVCHLKSCSSRSNTSSFSCSKEARRSLFSTCTLFNFFHEKFRPEFLFMERKFKSYAGVPSARGHLFEQHRDCCSTRELQDRQHVSWIHSKLFFPSPKVIVVETLTVNVRSDFNVAFLLTPSSGLHSSSLPPVGQDTLGRTLSSSTGEREFEGRRPL